MQKKITILSCVTACICVFVLVFNICLKTRDAVILPFLLSKGIELGTSKDEMLTKLGKPLKTDDDPLAAVEYDFYSFTLAGKSAEVVIDVNTEAWDVSGVTISWQLDNPDEAASIYEAIEQEIQAHSYAAIKRTEETTSEEHTIEYNSDSRHWWAKVWLRSDSVKLVFWEISDWMASG